jgi:antitoxin (DNA-binding transcriptional repressor) of toxin-antitoxin stability system
VNVQPAYAFGDDIEIEVTPSLRSAVTAVEDGNIVYLTDHHRRVAVIVPTEVAAVGFAAVAAIEDAALVAAAREALAEGGETVPLEQVLEEIGYSSK